MLLVRPTPVKLKVLIKTDIPYSVKIVTISSRIGPISLSLLVCELLFVLSTADVGLDLNLLIT